MAKSNGFFTMRSGSTKSLTFSKFNGKQITKDRVGTPKNPQTVSQMDQRMKAPAAKAFYDVFSEILSNSYEGVPYGTKSRWEFYKRAMAKDVLTCYPKDGKLTAITTGSAPTGYETDNNFIPLIGYNHGIQVSRGTLTPLSLKNMSDGSAFRLMLQSGTLVSADDVKKWSISSKVIDVYDMILSWFPQLEASPKPQLTYMLIKQTMQGDVSRQYVKLIHSEAFFFRVKLYDRDKYADDSEVTVAQSGDYGLINLIEKSTLEEGTSYLTCFSADSEEYTFAQACFIQSSFENNAWRRSTQDLIVSDPDEAQRYFYGIAEQCRNGYLKATSGPASNEYLNNGTTLS